MVLNVADAVEHRVAHVEVAGGEVDFGAKGVFALGEFTLSHALEEIEVFLDGPVAPGADGGARRVAAVFAELLGRQLADIREALFDQLYGILVSFLKIVGAVEESVAPVKAEPVDVLLDRLNVFGVLLGWVRVVKAEVAQAAEVFGGAEIDGQSLAVADMEITVRLGREAGVDLHAVAAVPLAKILLYKGLDKVSGRDFFHISITPVKKYFVIINDSRIKYKNKEDMKKRIHAPMYYRCEESRAVIR